MTTKTTTPDVLVIGGGVIGLAIAHRLAGTGRRVRLLERDRTGRGASWAAGGMLSPLGEADDPGPFLRLAVHALELWPGWAAEVEEETGSEVGLRLDGKTLVALDQASEEALRERYAWQRRDGWEVRWLDGEGARGIEPALSAGVRAALHLPTDGRVNPRALVEALAAAARHRGVEILERTAVRELVEEAGRVVGARTDDDRMHRATTTVLAAGAWAPGLAGDAPRPVKGQMLELAPVGRPLRGVVGAPGAYLIPRDTAAGHRIVVGATMEDAGFDLSTDAAALERLRAAAVTAIPVLAQAPRTDGWAGIRPGTRDGAPRLGPDPARPGLLHAHGHHRNGVLLAPVTARHVEGWLNGTPPADTEAFRPDR